MTTEHWLTVAVIITAIITAIATLLGPALAVIVQARISQPTPAPDANKPKAIIGKIRTWLRGDTAPKWGIRFVMVLSIFGLVLEMLSAAPATRWDILLIVLFVSAIGACMMFDVAIRLLLAIDRIAARVSAQKKE